MLALAALLPALVAAAPADCQQLRKTARFGIYFDKVELGDLLQTVSDATCKTFIVTDALKGRTVSILGPDKDTRADADTFYAAFVAALDAHGLSVVPSGRFVRIVERARARVAPLPLVGGDEASAGGSNGLVTRLHRLRFLEPEAARNFLGPLASPNAELVPLGAEVLAVTDLEANHPRLKTLIDALDRRPGSDVLRVVQVRYAAAQDLADRLTRAVESKARPGFRPGAGAPRMGTKGEPQGVPMAAGKDEAPAVITLVVADERTNKLVISASPAAWALIEALLGELDVPVESGQAQVWPLRHAEAKEVSQSLQVLVQGAKAARPAVPGAATSADALSADVRVSTDEASNALLLVGSPGELRSLRRLVEQLDVPRRQVFIEVAILEVNLDRGTQVGVSGHRVFEVPTEKGTLPVLLGTGYSKGGPPSLDLASLATGTGLLGGLTGPVVPVIKQATGLSIPSFGVVLQALAKSSDVNVVSTPHMLTVDNKEAEITVGQRFPFRSGGLTSTTTSAANNATNVLSALYGQGPSVTFERLEMKLSVKPHIGESDTVRLDINHHAEEIASLDFNESGLGPSTATRGEKTTVVAQDHQTIVLGGVMQDRTLESVSKVPVLGDLPVLGHLFRQTGTQKVKTNLLLVLTPHVVRSPAQFQEILERKLREREEVATLFYGQVPGLEGLVDPKRKKGPVQAMLAALRAERQRPENGGQGAPGESVVAPSEAPP